MTTHAAARARLKAGHALDPAGRHLHAAELAERILAGEDLTAVERMTAAGVILTAGQRHLERQARRAGRGRRDELIRELAAMHFADLSQCAQAERVAALGRRYYTTGWPLDVRHCTLPEHLKGKPEEYVWLCLVVDKRFPRSGRRILTILQAEL